VCVRPTSLGLLRSGFGIRLDYHTCSREPARRDEAERDDNILFFIVCTYARKHPTVLLEGSALSSFDHLLYMSQLAKDLVRGMNQEGQPSLGFSRLVSERSWFSPSASGDDDAYSFCIWQIPLPVRGSVPQRG